MPHATENGNAVATSETLSPQTATELDPGQLDEEEALHTDEPDDKAETDKTPENFEVGDIVERVEDDGQTGLVVYVHRGTHEDTLLVDEIDMDTGGTYSTLQSFPAKECVVCIGWNDVIRARERAGLSNEFPPDTKSDAGQCTVDPAVTIGGLLRLTRTIEDRYCRLIGETRDHLTAKHCHNIDAVVTTRVKQTIQQLEALLNDTLTSTIGAQVIESENGDESDDAPAPV